MVKTIQECYRDCIDNNADETMVSVEELEKANQAIDRLNRVEKKIVELMNDLQQTTKGRHMNDLEYGRYSALQDVIEFIDG